jgi:hypothetical protein
MAVTYNDNTAIFTGNCSVEEAENLAEWLKNTKDPKIELAGMEHIHTAILQCILYFQPEIISFPADKIWQEILC